MFEIPTMALMKSTSYLRWKPTAKPKDLLTQMHSITMAKSYQRDNKFQLKLYIY